MKLFRRCRPLGPARNALDGRIALVNEPARRHVQAVIDRVLSAATRLQP